MIKESSNRHPVVFNDICVGAGDVYEETLGENVVPFRRSFVLSKSVLYILIRIARFY